MFDGLHSRVTSATAPRPVEAAGRGETLSAAPWVLVAAYVFVGAFPAVFAGGVLLDGEWVLQLNRLGLGAFGRNVAFTYGPFGFLLYPATFTVHVILALLLRCAVLAALAAWVMTRASAIDRMVFAVGQVTAVGLGLIFEYQLLVPLLLLTARSFKDPAHRPARGTTMLAALAGFAFLVKFSLGVALAAVLGTVWLVRLLGDRGRAIRDVAVAACVGTATLLLAGVVGLEHATDLVPWLLRGLEMAGGYSEVMSLDTPGVPAAELTTVAAAAALMAVIGIGAWGTRQRSVPGLLALLSAGPAFLAFKHAFVRQDAWHIMVFFPFLLALAAAAALLAQTRAEKVLSRLAVVAAAASSFGVAAGYQQHTSAPTRSPLRSFVGLDGAVALRAWFSIEERRTEIAEDVARFDAPMLPGMLGGKAVGVVPYRIGLCEAGVTCTPNPTLQTYAAYTANLDEWSADHYLGERAPPFVLLHLDGVDHRSPALDHPSLWRALWAAYRVSSQQPGFGVLLERRSAFVAPRLVELGRTPVPATSWVPVPNVRGPLFAAIALDLTWLGRAQRFAFRIEPVLLALEYPDGTLATFRLVPDTARNGLPLDLIPLLRQEVAPLFDGGMGWRPSRIALFGDGLDSYRQPITVSWQQLEGSP